ncbi:MAG TPA: hypothetical protein VMM60_10425 [Ilumatobacter sp.]|nr:hypothetical protein [Ilumatobacter sp.]
MSATDDRQHDLDHQHHQQHDQQHDLDHPIEDFDRGLAFDLSNVSRRRLLGLLGSASIGVVALAACGSDSSTAATTASTTPATPGTTAATTGAATTGTATTGTALPATTATTEGTVATTAATAATTPTATATTEIPDETGGPYPGDGTNGVNVLTEADVVRSDIRSSFGSASGVADGIPMTVTLSVQDIGGGGVPLAGAAVYLWHCTADGLYSLYSSGVTEENFLRGVQVADANGQVTFTTIIPGCYAGRWPHMHFEIYETVAAATNGRNAIKTSQLALPQAMCETVYTDSRYTNSTRNLSQVSLSSDNVFSEDSAALQLPVITGDNASGYGAVLPVGV